MPDCPWFVYCVAFGFVLLVFAGALLAADLVIHGLEQIGA